MKNKVIDCPEHKKNLLLLAEVAGSHLHSWPVARVAAGISRYAHWLANVSANSIGAHTHAEMNLIVQELALSIHKIKNLEVRATNMARLREFERIILSTKVGKEPALSKLKELLTQKEIGNPFKGADLYVTLRPCKNCLDGLKLLELQNIYYSDEHPNPEFTQKSDIAIASDEVLKKIVKRIPIDDPSINPNYIFAPLCLDPCDEHLQDKVKAAFEQTLIGSNATAVDEDVATKIAALLATVNKAFVRVSSGQTVAGVAQLPPNGATELQKLIEIHQAIDSMVVNNTTPNELLHNINIVNKPIFTLKTDRLQATALVYLGLRIPSMQMSFAIFQKAIEITEAITDKHELIKTLIHISSLIISKNDPINTLFLYESLDRLVNARFFGICELLNAIPFLAQLDQGKPAQFQPTKNDRLFDSIMIGAQLIRKAFEPENIGQQSLAFQLYHEAVLDNYTSVIYEENLKKTHLMWNKETLEQYLDLNKILEKVIESKHNASQLHDYLGMYLGVLQDINDPTLKTRAIAMLSIHLTEIITGMIMDQPEIKETTQFTDLLQALLTMTLYND